MQDDSGIFTITPPDMQLNVDGPSITVISKNKDLIQEVEDAHESLFKTVSVNIYHPNGDVKESNLAWCLSVMRLSDTVFIDLDTANELGILTAIVSGSNLAWIEGKERKDVIKLFNADKNGYPIYSDIKSYMDIMLSRISDLL